jgi:hypothetical protein
MTNKGQSPKDKVEGKAGQSSNAKQSSKPKWQIKSQGLGKLKCQNPNDN